MYTFAASTKQISHLSDVFQAVASVDPVALIVISPLGINLYSEHNHIINSGLSISPALFRTYNFYLNDSQNLTQNSDVGNSTEELRLVIDIKAISECLFAMKLSKRAILANNASKLDNPNAGVKLALGEDVALRRDVESSLQRTSFAAIDEGAPQNSTSVFNYKDDSTEKTCYFTYNGDGSPFILEFEDTFITEKIEFFTHYVADDDFGDKDNMLVNYGEIEWEMIVKSDVLANILKDMKSIGTTSVYMHVSNDIVGLGGLRRRNGPQMVNREVYFISKGPLGNLKLIFPNEKTILERLDMYRWDEDTDTMVAANISLTSHYNFQSFHRVFGSVSNSIKCKISKDLLGTLSVQMLSKNDQLPNYPGTLVTFNILGLLDDVDANARESLNEMSINAEFGEDLIYNYQNLKHETGLIGEHQALENLEESHVEEHTNRRLQTDDNEAENVVDIPLFL